MVVQTLVFIFGAILVANFIFTLLLWFSYKEAVFKDLILFWLAGLISFIAQGVFNSLDLKGFLAFSINAATVLLMSKILYRTAEVKLPWKTYCCSLLFGFSSSVVLFLFGQDFTTSTFPFVLSCAIILLNSSYYGFKAKGLLNSGYAFILFLDAMHFLDYPWLRAQEKFAVLGFSLTLAFYFSYSIYIPLYIIKKNADKYSAKLEEEVRKRTQQLTEMTRQLIDTNCTLEVKNHDLDKLANENKTLLSLLVHDLGTPLQMLFSFIDKATPNKLPEEIHVSRERALRATFSIREILGTIRNFHAAKLGKSNPNFKVHSITALINECILNLESKLSEKEIKINFINKSDNDIFMNIDDSWFKNQILANLLTNAIKFSEPKSHITIEIHSFNKTFKIFVRDFGVGIPDKMTTKIFDFNTETTRIGTAGEKGTGLGLPIVKEYTELLNGKIKLVPLPKEEKGTCFELEFASTGSSKGEMAA